MYRYVLPLLATRGKRCRDIVSGVPASARSEDNLDSSTKLSCHFQQGREGWHGEVHLMDLVLVLYALNIGLYQLIFFHNVSTV